MSDTVHAAIGIGSNIGDRRGTIESAVQQLDAAPGVTVTAVSTIIETAPVGSADQGPFLNAAVLVTTTLTPRGVLETCLRIEATHGRRRAAGTRWGPRTLDLDLLLFGPAIIDEPGLVVPHPRLHERGFALLPLAEIAPDWIHPERGVRIQCLLRTLEASVASDLDG